MKFVILLKVYSKKMKYICIIPARSGSKRLKDKNIKKLGNRTLLEHAIEFSFSINSDRVIVSSDSIKYGQIAENNGAEFIRRTVKNSQDSSKDIDVVKELVLNKHISLSDKVIWLRPCSPFRSYEECNKAIRKFSNSNASSLRSVRKYQENPFWHLVLSAKDFAKPLINNNYTTTYLNKLVYPTAEFDIFKVSTALKQNTIIPNKILTFLTKKYRICDIDTKQDMQYAKYIFNLINKQ